MKDQEEPTQTTRQRDADDEQSASSSSLRRILKRVEAVLAVNGKDPDALFARATALAALGDTGQAIETLNHLSKVNHKYPGLWLLKAKVYDELGEVQKAKLCYERALEIEVEREKLPDLRDKMVQKPILIATPGQPRRIEGSQEGGQETGNIAKVSIRPGLAKKAQADAEGFTNGLRVPRTGMVNGLGRPMGMVNGLATETKKAGKTNGLSKKASLSRLGMTNGLTNGNGFTNGLGSTRFRRETISHRWKLFSMAAFAALLLLIPLFTPPTFQNRWPFEKIIDGSFEDWAGVTEYSQSQGNASANIDIVGVSTATDSGGVEILVEVRGQMLAGGPDPPGLMDVIYVFADTDRLVSTGYSVRGMGADYLVEIQGLGGRVVEAMIWKATRSEMDSRDWRIWTSPLQIHAASAGSRLEVAVDWLLMGGNTVSPAFLVASLGHDRSADFADTMIGIRPGIVTIRQESIAPAVISGQNIPLLALNVTAVVLAAKLSSIQVHFTGTAPLSSLEMVTIFDDAGAPIATQMPFSNPVTISFPTMTVVPGVTRRMTIAVTTSISSGDTLGATIQSSSSVDAGDSLVTLETAETLEQLGYLGRIPSSPMIDGAFSDWSNESGQGQGGGQGSGNPSIEVDRFGTAFGGGEMLFHVRLRGRAFAGTVLTTNPKQRPTSQTAEPDSDGDSVPDSQDLYPLDFNNDGVSDIDSHGDVDGDGLSDRDSGGIDVWLNTTIPINFPMSYAGTIVSRYVGPIDQLPLIGEDQLRMLIDYDNITATGFYMEGMGFDYMVELRGREGRVSKAVLYRHAGANPGIWSWTEISNLFYASGLMQLEAQVDLSPLVPYPSIYIEMSDWNGKKATSSRGTRGGETEPVSQEVVKPSFVASGQSPFSYRSSGSRLNAYLRGSRGRSEDLVIQYGNLVIGWRTIGIADSNGEIVRPSNANGTAAGHDYILNGFPGGWEQYTIGEDRIKHNLWLFSPLELHGESISLEGEMRISQGSRVLVEDKQIDGPFVTQNPVIIDLDGRRIRLEPPFAYESRNPGNRISGEYAGEVRGSTMSLSMTVPGEWLRDPSREYPVVIDPTGIIDTTTSPTATGGPSQRNVFYDGTNFWAFYYDGSTIVYEPSPDGLSWVNTKSTAFTTASVTRVSTWFHDTGSSKIVYIVGDTATASTNVRVRRGTISGTTIAWGNEYGITVSNISLASKIPFVTRDSSGYVWVGSGAQPNTDETWYFRTSAGVACGAGDRESLSLTAGSGAATKALDATGDTWNRQEASARTIVAGTWYVRFDLTVGSGSGGQNKVNVLVERRNSACVVQQTLVNGDVNVVKGSAQEYVMSAALGELTINTNDIITVTLTDSGGNQLKTVRYDNSAGTDADSRLIHPQTKWYGYTASRSTNADDVSAWGSFASLTTNPVTNNYVQGQIVPLGSGEVYALWYADGSIAGKKYSGSWGSEESIDTTSAGDLTKAASAVVDAANYIHLVFVDSSGAVKYRRRTTAWEAATTLDSSSGNSYPTITLETTSGDLYALYIASGNQMKCKKYSGGSWSDVSLETNTNVKSRLTSTYNVSSSSNVAWSWTQGSGSPYDVKFSLLSTTLRSRTVDTSTITTPLRYGHQRKMFHDGTYYWIFYEDGTELVYTYSSDGLTWENARTAAFSSATRNQASVWYHDASTDVVYAVSDGVGTATTVTVRRGTISGSTISWGTEASATASTVSLDNQWPFICRATDDYLWIVSNALPSAGNYNVAAIRSSNTDDISSWDTITYLRDSSIASTYIYASIVPLTGVNVYSYWYANGNIEGKKYSGSWGSQESIASTSPSTDRKLPSAVVDGSADIHLVYSDINGRVNYTMRTDASSSWSSPTTIDSNTGNTHPTITRDTSTGDLYAFWLDSTDQIKGKKYSSGSWTSITDIDTSTIVKFDLTSPYSVSSSSSLAFGFDQGGSSPYEVKFAAFSVIPEFGDLALPLVMAIPILLVIRRRSKSVRRP